MKFFVLQFSNRKYNLTKNFKILGVTGDLIVLTSALKRWYHFISQEVDNEEFIPSSDHHIKVLEILTVLRSASEDLNLSSLELNELTDHTEALRVAVIDLFIVSMTISSVQFSQDNWDFILCTLVSWLKVLIFLKPFSTFPIVKFYVLYNFDVILCDMRKPIVSFFLLRTLERMLVYFSRLA